LAIERLLDDLPHPRGEPDYRLVVGDGAVLGRICEHLRVADRPALEDQVALIGKGFTESGVRRAAAKTLAGNWGSRRVLEKPGLTQAATFASAGPDAAGSTGKGHVIYELARAGREARHRPVS
jgi:hypothetical protein